MSDDHATYVPCTIAPKDTEKDTEEEQGEVIAALDSLEKLANQVFTSAKDVLQKLTPVLQNVEEDVTSAAACEEVSSVPLVTKITTIRLVLRNISRIHGDIFKRCEL